MIRNISVEHYKSLSNVSIQLGPLNIFVGPNGSGKSNLIDSIMLIRDCVRHDIETAVSQRFGIDSIRQWSRRSPFQIRIGLTIRTARGSGNFRIHLGSTKGQHRVLSEYGVWRLDGSLPRATPANASQLHRPIQRANYTRQGRNVRVFVRAGTNLGQQDFELDDDSELFLSSVRSVPISIKSGDKLLSAHLLQELWRNLYDFEYYSIFPNTLRTPQSISRDFRLTSSGDNITTIFKNLGKTKQGQQARLEILEGMRLIMPGLENIIIQSAGGFLVPSFRMKEGETTHDFNVSQISDGTLRVFGMLTALHQLHGPAVMALEEPEQTIHPGALAIVADSISAVATRKQILVTTHSPHLLDIFGVESLWAVRMDEART